MLNSIKDILSYYNQMYNFEINDYFLKIIYDLFCKCYVIEEKENMSISSNKKCYLYYDSNRNKGMLRIEFYDDMIVITTSNMENKKYAKILNNSLIIKESINAFDNSDYMIKQISFNDNLITLNFDYNNLKSNIQTQLKNYTFLNSRPLLETNKFYVDDSINKEKKYLSAYELFKSRKIGNNFQ